MRDPRAGAHPNYISLNIISLEMSSELPVGEPPGPGKYKTKEELMPLDWQNSPYEPGEYIPADDEEAKDRMDWIEAERRKTSCRTPDPKTVSTSRTSGTIELFLTHKGGKEKSHAND